MRERAVTIFILTSLFANLSLAFNIGSVESEWLWTETIYIRVNGSVEPVTAPITTVDNITYTFTDNIVANLPSKTSAIIVEKNNIVIDGADYTLRGNMSQDSKGIHIEGRSNVTIRNVEIRGFARGAYLKASQNCDIVQNRMISNGEAFSIFSAANYNRFLQNNVTENGSGVRQEYSSYNTFSGNKITYNTNQGFYFFESRHNMISGNRIENNNNYGIKLYSPYFHFSYNNTVCENNIADNNGYGIYIILMLNNSVYHNNFMNNSAHFGHYGGLPQFWDNGYPSGGNYWDNYTGVDLYSGSYQNVTGSDGIGDAPYIVEGDHKDSYPLMKTFNGPVRNLGTGYSYPTIQEGIDDATEGDSILALSGTYYENIVVDKSLSLLGEEKLSTIIDGNGMGNVVYVTAHNVTVTGFTVRNSGTAQWNSGIRFHDCDNGTIVGNIVKKCDNGIRLMYCDNCLIRGNYIDEPRALHYNIVALSSSYCTIENNIAMNTGHGIRWDLSHHLGIRGNILQNNVQGIAAINVDQSLIIENTVINSSQYGAAFGQASTDNTIFHNSFINNTQQIILTEGSTNFVLDNGYPSGGNYWSDYKSVDVRSGLYQNETGKDGIGDSPRVIDSGNQDDYPLMYRWNPMPVNNIDTGLGYDAIQAAIDAPETLGGHTIYIKAGTYYEHVQVHKSIELLGAGKSNTIIDGSSLGDPLNIFASNVDVTSITLQNSGAGYFGIRIRESSNGNRISYCTITNNYYGIWLYQSSNNFIVGNSITDSQAHGFLLDASSNNTISGNLIANNHYYGLYLWHSSDSNVVVGNSIANNDYIIWLLDSSNNKLYHNNFVNNTNQVVVSPTGCANSWDNGYPNGGNYWSIYSGSDLFKGPYQNETGSDGIGDTPYTIDPFNFDRYPILQSYIWRPVPADANGDHVVNILDMGYISGHWSSTPDGLGYDMYADVNGDGVINILDMGAVSGHWGETW